MISNYWSIKGSFIMWTSYYFTYITFHKCVHNINWYPNETWWEMHILVHRISVLSYENSQCFLWGLMGYAFRSIVRTACMIHYVVAYYITAISYHTSYSAYGGIYMVDRLHLVMYIFKNVLSFASQICFTTFHIRCGHILRQVWKTALQRYACLKINIDW